MPRANAKTGPALRPKNVQLLIPLCALRRQRLGAVREPESCHTGKYLAGFAGLVFDM